MKPHIKLQHDIKLASEDTRNSLQDMYNWQKEMKEKEKNRLKGGQCEGSQIPEIRSKTYQDKRTEPPALQLGNKDKQNDENTKSEKLKTETKVHDDTKSDVSKQNEGDLCKEMGNKCVKIGKYEDAIHHYTAAINYFDMEPIYYANRALCYLKLERYSECIRDCDQAIKLNKTNIKAHYRRMQAYETIGEDDEALLSCQTVLQLDPKNVEAKTSHQRLINRIKKRKLYELQKPPFTNPNSLNNAKIMEMFSKPAHLRSNKPLKNIKITEEFGGKSILTQYTDDVLDKLFTYNNASSYEEIKKSNKIQDKASIQDVNIDGKKDNKNEHDQIKDIFKENSEPIESFVKDKIKKEKPLSFNYPNVPQSQNHQEKKSKENIDLVIPKTSTQFYTVWAELSPEKRYEYLKIIPVKKINQVLGLAVEIDFLTEIFLILNEFYVKDNNLDMVEILKELIKHERFSIAHLFFTKETTDLLKNLVRHMQQNNVKQEDIDLINDEYYLVPKSYEREDDQYF